MTGFESHRSHLFGIAYRMLGSATEAEDVVQEAFLRWQEMPADSIRSDRAFLSTVVTRLCLDQLKSARARREEYVGPWLPEPVHTDESTTDPETLSLAFLVLLESLTPLERAVFLLHEVFDYGHAEVAAMLGRDEAAIRQVFHRAKQHVLEKRPRFAPSKEEHRRVLRTFVDACATGDLAGLRNVLASDVIAWSDGGGKTAAARKPLHGADVVARFYAGLFAKATPEYAIDIEDVNGWPAVVTRRAGAVVNVIAIETDGRSVYAVRTIVNPDKLSRL